MAANQLDFQTITFTNGWWGQQVEIQASFAIPKDGVAKHAVMIIMPSSGDLATRDWDIAALIYQRGAAVFVVDSLGSRHIRELYKHKTDLDAYHEAADAASAIRYLEERPDIDVDRIGVMGRSLGADAAMLLSMISFEQNTTSVVGYRQ